MAVQAASLLQVKISPRLASARMKGTIVILTVISVNSPTLDTEEEAEDSIYNENPKLVVRAPTGGMPIVTGDLNARPI